MKNQIATRTVSKIVLAGLIVSMLPMNLTAKTRKARPQTLKKTSLSLSSWKTQRPSKEAIDSAIKHITKLTKRLRRINIIVTSLIAGAGVLGIAAGAGLAIIGMVLLLLLPGAIIGTAVPLGTGAAVVSIGTLMIIPGTVISSIVTIPTIAASIIITGIITAIISGHTAISLLAPITGGLTTAGIITPLAFAKTLKNIEKKYPGILTMEQANAIGKLNKIIRGSINKGIVKGMRLKTALKSSVNIALQQGTGLSKKRIQNYITKSRSERNLQSAIDTHKEKIKKQKETRDRHPKLSFAWHAKNIKRIALKTKPKYIIWKIRLKRLKKQLWGIRKYPLFTQKLAQAVSDYIEAADEITADLARELAEAVAAAKKRGKK